VRASHRPPRTEHIFLIEEYSNKGDILHDMLTYPARYSEAFVAVRVVEPLLQALAYLHEHHVIHRCAAAWSALARRVAGLWRCAEVAQTCRRRCFGRTSLLLPAPRRSPPALRSAPRSDHPDPPTLTLTLPTLTLTLTLTQPAAGACSRRT
jgi:hypothetical protein